jgi:hypothetical protein
MNTRTVSQVIAVALVAMTFAQAPVGAAMKMQGGRAGGPAEQSPMRVGVKLLVERIDKDKATTTIPFELVVRPGRETTLNHGRLVATPQNMDKNGVTYYGYQSIGSNVMISDMNVTEKVITFSLMIDISAVDPTPNPAVPVSQSFRKYTLQSSVTVQPGVPSTITISTDQTNAETVRLSVTATVLQ